MFVVFFSLYPRFGKESKAVVFLLEKTTENLNTPEHLKEVKISVHGTFSVNQYRVVPYSTDYFKTGSEPGFKKKL